MLAREAGFVWRVPAERGASGSRSDTGAREARRTATAATGAGLGASTSAGAQAPCLKT